MAMRVAFLVAVAAAANARVLASTYTIATVAGTGSNGFNGAGGPATSTQLNCPAAVAYHPGRRRREGTLYVSEVQGMRVRAVVDGQMTTFGGPGPRLGFCGDDGPATSACLYE